MNLETFDKETYRDFFDKALNIDRTNMAVLKLLGERRCWFQFSIEKYGRAIKDGIEIFAILKPKEYKKMNLSTDISENEYDDSISNAQKKEIRKIAQKRLRHLRKSNGPINLYEVLDLDSRADSDYKIIKAYKTLKLIYSLKMKLTISEEEESEIEKNMKKIYEAYCKLCSQELRIEYEMSLRRLKLKRRILAVTQYVITVISVPIFLMLI